MELGMGNVLFAKGKGDRPARERGETESSNLHGGDDLIDRDPGWRSGLLGR